MTSREDRVAVLLDLLGDDVARSVLDHMSGDREAKLRQRLATIDQSPLPAREVDQIVEDFDRFFQFALNTTDLIGGSDQKLLPAEADNTEKGEGGKVSSKNADSAPAFEFTDDPSADLNRLEPFQVAGALRDDNPRTAAMVIDCLPPDKAGMVLGQLPDEMRPEVFLQLKQHPTAAVWCKLRLR